MGSVFRPISNTCDYRYQRQMPNGLLLEFVGPPIRDISARGFQALAQYEILSGPQSNPPMWNWIDAPLHIAHDGIVGVQMRV